MKKNILIMALGKQFGGTEKYIINIIKSIDYYKFNIHICVNKNSLFSNHLKEKKYNNIKILEIDVSKKRLLKDIHVVRDYIVEKNIEVIHNNGVLTEVITFLSSRKMKEIVKISTVHGFSSFDRMDRSILEKLIFEILEKKMFKYSDKYIAVSESIKQYLIERGLKSDKVTVIHHGIDKLEDSQYCNDNKINGTITIGSIGRLEEVKGYKFLVEAVKLLVDKGYNIKCYVLGDGTLKSQLNLLAHNLDIENNINFLGFSDDIYQFLNTVDIYVQPSIQESFGISILEAMNMSRPVIASNVGGIPEIIETNKNGLLFESQNHDDLANKIEILVCDEEKRHTIAKNGRDRFLNKFTKEIFIERLSELYSYRKDTI